ncbi:hypothetical protein Verru16b_02116 [Lacunisphaera limnophila]|uniref:Uncharacterized protein n=1 Tax=Lacunisphaera limnophila TaxID=1838286 RepID=A0A1D8AVX8_9BACT|nr:hypothetical protein [Lacunisphaera limnophila]AOS45047.1 hypothetical protein Verru16b_02116 [Lacunisphaera limnophila]
MKANTLLALVSFAVIASTVPAAANQTESKPYVLPTYVVSAPRYQPVERLIQSSLDELRQRAAAPVVLRPELPLLQAGEARTDKLVKVRPAAAPKTLAKS